MELRTASNNDEKRIVIGMTGATGAILGIKLLITLRRLNVETQLVISQWAEATMKYETDYTPANVRALADHVHSNHDQAAPISSGSFHANGMIIFPCSMKTLAAVNAEYCDDLISRAADVMLKERRRLVLAVRETPLSEIHKYVGCHEGWGNHLSGNASVLYKTWLDRRSGRPDGGENVRFV
ncbi:phenylacrylic acid decarboxylase [Sclerotinia borealis F-4128]|uniref:Phenylacrylic acid decarboxylase n=1 Tax=Sclerotinia borealis (strain F-4128) TaxID=1432307 RepID=W9C2J3_SCLBF|nr:phenylacrylic acid decarboxylase [Sclerotinia borealis F-4128]